MPEVLKGSVYERYCNDKPLQAALSMSCLLTSDDR